MMFLRLKTLVLTAYQFAREKTKNPRQLLKREILIPAAAIAACIAVGGFYLGTIKSSVIKAIMATMHGPGAVTVTVTPVTKQTIPVYYKYVGNTAAINYVDIRARVEGFLSEVKFVEGADVNQGDLLFVIDQAPFRAALDRAQATLDKDQAALDYAKKEVERYRPLVKKDYITKESFDQYETNVRKAEAEVAADAAQVETAKLNLSYCSMYAPVSGRIGKMLVTIGNLVGAGGKDTVLATLVQLDPIYAYFSPSDRDSTEILRNHNSGPIEATLTFSDGTKFDGIGKVDFINNQVDVRTSTVNMRAIIPNPQKILLPGNYVNVQLNLGNRPDTLLVPDKAITQLQGSNIVYIVDDKGVVNERTVDTANSYNNMRVIISGLKEGEMVVTDGIQRVREGMKVVANVAK